MATLQDIAQKAGVAKSTISRCLRNDATLVIPEETRNRIFAAAAELQYAIKPEKMITANIRIAVIHKNAHFLRQTDNAYYFSIRSAIETACHRNSWSLSFIPTEFLHTLPQDINGAIILGNFEKEQTDSILAALHTQNLVFIGLHNWYPADLDWITYNTCDCVELALNHLIETGHRTVLYAGGRDTAKIAGRFQKIAQFKNAVESTGTLTCTEYLTCEHGVENGYTMMKEYLTQNPRLPEAVFVSNDPIAIGILRAFGEAKIRVPDDISVISINGDSSGALVFPQLTSVDVHTFDMGREAVTALGEHMTLMRLQPKKVEFYPTLIERGTVGNHR